MLISRLNLACVIFDLEECRVLLLLLLLFFFFFFGGGGGGTCDWNGYFYYLLWSTEKMSKFHSPFTKFKAECLFDYKVTIASFFQ